MSDYERLRQRHLAHAMALGPHLIDQLEWPSERLSAHRIARLQELVAVAKQRSPWYRERLRDVDPARLDVSTLQEVPPMTKAELMEHFDQIVTDERLSLELVNAHLAAVSTGGYLLDRYTAVTSAGSSGERGVFVYDWDGWSTFWLGLFRYLLRDKLRDPELAWRPVVMATVMAAHFTHATAAMSRTFTGPHFTNHRFPVTLPTAEIVAGLNAVHPDFLLAYPSALHVLSFEATAGRLRIAPRRVLCGGEPLLPEIRAAAEAAWGVRVGNWWGSSEGGGMGVACDHGGTHLNEDLLIVEPVDGRGRPVGPGARSAKMYLTNLYNHALPLIRYEITDEVRVLREPCACRSAMRCVGDVQGRLDDVFEYAEGRLHPHVFRSALGRHAGIVEYQVRQTPDGAHIAVRCESAVDLDTLCQELEEALCGLGIERPEITIETVERVNRHHGATKLKRFVPLGTSDCHEERVQASVATHL